MRYFLIKSLDLRSEKLLKAEKWAEIFTDSRDMRYQLVCLWPVGILNNVMFNLEYLLQLFAQPH